VSYPRLPRVIAHRGGGMHAPENTLAGFRFAARQGFTAVEFDVRLAACGTLVLLHDGTLDRTTSARGAVRAMTYAELAHVDAGVRHGDRFPGERLPTLEDAWRCCRDLGLAANVEIKADPGDEVEAGRAVGTAVASLWRPADPAVIVSSFSESALVAAGHAAPGVARGLLVEAIPGDWADRLARTGASGLHAGIRVWNSTLAAAVASSGVPLLAYTVNDRERARAVLASGASALFTDRVEAEFAVL
jgi:glycerophosphoryl diester phosphodiesterase